MNRVILGHIHLSNGLELIDIDERFRRDQAEAGDDDESAWNAGIGGIECGGVSHLAAKVQAANESVEFADGGAALAELSG